MVIELVGRTNISIKYFKTVISRARSAIHTPPPLSPLFLTPTRCIASLFRQKLVESNHIQTGHQLTPTDTVYLVNVVKWEPYGITSSGRGHHVLHEIPDRYQINVCKLHLNIKHKIKGTWNVRTLLKKISSVQFPLSILSMNGLALIP